MGLVASADDFGFIDEEFFGEVVGGHVCGAEGGVGFFGLVSGDTGVPCGFADEEAVWADAAEVGGGDEEFSEVGIGVGLVVPGVEGLGGGGVEDGDCATEFVAV